MRQTETIEWHPFPEEKPELETRYLITDIDGDVHTEGWGVWGKKSDVNRWRTIEDEYVKAWANIPKGYK